MICSNTKNSHGGDILAIPSGNDFKIRISPARIVPRQQEASFALIDGLAAKVTRNNGEARKVEHKITPDGDIIVSIPHDLKCVVYGLELNGTYQGDAWQWADCSIFHIVDCNPCSMVCVNGRRYVVYSQRSTKHNVGGANGELRAVPIEWVTYDSSNRDSNMQ